MDFEKLLNAFEMKTGFLHFTSTSVSQILTRKRSMFKIYLNYMTYILHI